MPLFTFCTLLTLTFLHQFHFLLVLRNMHDEGAADIPVLFVNWSDRTIGLAMDYWLKLSQGIWESNNEARDDACAPSHFMFSQNSYP